MSTEEKTPKGVLGKRSPKSTRRSSRTESSKKKKMKKTRINLNGTWILDPKRPSSMDKHLQSIGIAERARLGAAKLEEGLVVTIRHNEEKFSITRVSDMNRAGDTKDVAMGKDVTIEGKNNKPNLQKIMRVDIVDDDKLVTKTLMPHNSLFGMLRDTRTTDGTTMFVKLELYPPGAEDGTKADPVVTNRFYIRKKVVETVPTLSPIKSTVRTLAMGSAAAASPGRSKGNKTTALSLMKERRLSRS